MKLKLLALLAIAVFAFASCQKQTVNPGTPGNTDVVKIAPNGFNFATTTNVRLNISLLTNNNQPISGVIVNVYAPGSLSIDSSIFKGVTDKNGNLTGSVTVPTYLSQLVIDPRYIGLLRYATANINGNSVTATIGGKAGFSGDIIIDAAPGNNFGITRALHQTNSSSLSTEFGYPTGYTSSNAFASPTNLGIPVYLDATKDVISATMLSYVNSSLPEGTPITISHPEYLQNTVNNINIVSNTDVWVTFVSEGAGNLNSLGYFTYPTTTPPTRASGGTLLGGIDKITYIFPNASALNSGGGLLSGQRVHLGTFTAGTTISFVLIQNGWSGKEVISGNQKFYAINNFNPETVSSLQQHAINLYDELDQVNLFGFEDLNRQTGSDNDFNDIVFYATSSPGAISQTGVSVVDKGTDTDGDGVPDQLDAFPNDPTKAFISYYPSQTTYGDIAFEDNWPTKGDYDLNDLVVKYQYSFVSNAKNQIVSMTGTFSVDAAGASFKNGFGVQLPVSASTVQSVTGCMLSAGTYISLAGNGVEAGQSKAVIIPFDTHDIMIKNPDLSYFVNSLTTKNKVTSNVATVTVTFNTPVDPSVLTPSALNPFLISNMRRGYEIHLPGYAPTDLANTKLFGAGDDNSNPATGRYYLSSANWPWAINFSQSFNYPLEGINITQAFLHFTDWAASGGTSFTDWYSNTASGYRNSANIYSK